jgi:hypothetical protein
MQKKETGLLWDIMIMLCYMVDHQICFDGRLAILVRGDNPYNAGTGVETIASSPF